MAGTSEEVYCSLREQFKGDLLLRRCRATKHRAASGMACLIAGRG